MAGGLVIGGLLLPIVLAADIGHAILRIIRRRPREEAGGDAIGRVLTAGQ